MTEPQKRYDGKVYERSKHLVVKKSKLAKPTTRTRGATTRRK